MHRNNCENLNPDRPLPPIWRGEWVTPEGNIIRAMLNFVAYERVLMARLGRAV